MTEFAQIIGYFFLFVISVGGLFFLLSLVGGATNTSYKIRGVGTVEPTKVSNEAIEENIKVVKSSFKKIGLNTYEKILIDINTFLKREKGLSILFVRKYVYYGKILYSGINTFATDAKFKENIRKALQAAKDNDEEQFFMSNLVENQIPNQRLIVENLESKIEYRTFDETSLKLSQILKFNQYDIETLIYSTSIENAFYIEEIANKIITAFWKNRLTKDECQKLIEYIYSNYSLD